jgi:magnesium transporter
MTASLLNEPLTRHVRRDVTLLETDQSIADALVFLRSQSLGERIVYFYVVDRDRRLAGVVPTRRLLMSDPQASIGSVMNPVVISVPETGSLGAAADELVRHKLLAIPVVDTAGRLVGAADVGMFASDLSDVFERQQADNIFQLIGARVRRPASAWAGFLDRFPWLLCNVGGGIIAASIAGRHESLLEAVIALALFIPVVLAVSESIGMQAVTLTLQTLHGSPAGWRARLSAIRREVATAGLIAVACGVIVGGTAALWKGPLLVGVAIGATVAVAMTTAAVMGVALPILLRGARRDPRIASGPIVLALTDFVALMVYFAMAESLLG